MVMALFLTFMLSTFALAFVTLMLEDSRGSRSSAWQLMAGEGAEWGIETAMSYMGRGGNWQAAFDPQRLVFYDLLNPNQPNGVDHLVPSGSNSPGIRVSISAGTGAESALRTLTITNAKLPNSAALDLGDGLFARVRIEVRPVVVPLASFGAGQAPQYQLRSISELYRDDPSAQGGSEPVAVSQVEALVRPDVETTALFQIQNLRSWDAQGGGVGNPQMADRILIPSNYQSAGSVKVTGSDPNDPNAPWKAESGNIRFQDPNSENLVFAGQLSVNKLSNLDAGGNAINNTSPQNFPGGVVYGADFLPLPSSERFLSGDDSGDGVLGQGTPPIGSAVSEPNQEWGLLAIAALDTDGPSTPHGDLVNGYYRVGKELVVEAHQRHPKVPNSIQNMSSKDLLPPIPEVEVVLKKDGFIEVNIWETNFGDGGFSSEGGNLNSSALLTMGSKSGPLGEAFHVDQLKNGVLYVEGGQVIVRSELSAGETAEFEGRLQIVAAEDGLRRGVKNAAGELRFPNTGHSLYHPAATDYLNWQRQRLALDSDDPNHLPPERFRPPPYTASDLLAASQAGAISASTADLQQVDGSAPFWTPPSSSVESEGNLVIAGNIEKKEGTNSLIGLTAENFLLLNDRTLGQKADKNHLIVEAVLTSFEHSLQFDWDNTSNNRVPSVSSGSSYLEAMTPGFDGKITIKGSMLSPYSDVEGDLKGRGYPRQEFLHDSDLARWSPPFQPRTLLSEYPNEQISISWTIVDFKDRTSRGVSSQATD